MDEGKTNHSLCSYQCEMSYEYCDNLPKESSERYKMKLRLIGLKQCPYKFPASAWKEDPTEWPTLSYHHLYHYLIKSPRIYTPEAMENFKSLEAWKFFRAGWVQTIMHMKLDGGIVLMKCDVRPSYRTTGAMHKPWVAVKSDGNVVSAHCDCMAGLGETCSHVGATLYKIEAAVRTGLTHDAPTDIPCKWNQTFTRNIPGAPVSMINIYSDKAKQKLSDKVKDMPNEPSEEEKMNFLKEIHQVQPKTVALSLFGDFTNNFIDNSTPKECNKLPPTLRSLYTADSTKYTDDWNSYCVTQKDALKVTPDQACYIEEATRNQSLSESWYQQRAGRITGSVFREVVKASVENPPMSLILKICKVTIHPVRAKSLLWGREHEPVATTLYQNIYGDKNYVTELLSLTDLEAHLDFEILPVGLCVDINMPWYGASPDGAVNCSCCGLGVFEVKCPYTLKEETSSLKREIDNDNFYIKYTDEQGYFLDPNHQYFYQVQLEMYVTTSTRYCDFMVWTPKEFVIVRIYPDENFLGIAFEKANVFWDRVILPELITRKVENGQKRKNTEESTVNEKLYCLCKTKFTGTLEMVGCDQCDEWFHYGCVNLKGAPTSETWYCPACRKARKKQ